MIKQIKKFQIKLTPFDATKEWMMSTTNNQNVLLMDDPAVDPEQEPVALEFIDFGGIEDSPFINSECNIALEQQPDDLVNIRTGLNISGLFYPDLDPVNDDKTYKRVVYSQVRTMFYNRYNNPTETWGAENIDFNLSQTRRKLSDEFRLFGVPQNIYGDKIIPNTVTLIDNSLDTNFSITDDGKGNLVAGNNLFSRQQEIGNHPNYFQNGSSTFCNNYFVFGPPAAPVLYGSVPVTATYTTGSLSWTLADLTPDGFILEKSLDNINFTTLATLNGNTYAYDDYPITASINYYYRVNAFNSFGTGSYSNTVNLYFVGCLLLDTRNQIYTQGPYDTFECYATASLTQSANYGYGWDSGWDVRSPGSPDFALVISLDSFDDYVSVSGGSVLGLNSGSGWLSAWTGST